MYQPSRMPQTAHNVSSNSFRSGLPSVSMNVLAATTTMPSAQELSTGVTSFRPRQINQSRTNAATRIAALAIKRWVISMKV